MPFEEPWAGRQGLFLNELYIILQQQDAARPAKPFCRRLLLAGSQSKSTQASAHRATPLPINALMGPPAARHLSPTCVLAAQVFHQCRHKAGPQLTARLLPQALSHLGIRFRGVAASQPHQGQHRVLLRHRAVVDGRAVVQGLQGRAAHMGRASNQALQQAAVAKKGRAAVSRTRREGFKVRGCSDVCAADAQCGAGMNSAAVVLRLWPPLQAGWPVPSASLCALYYTQAHAATSQALRQAHSHPPAGLP